jgi:hypothetical protein
MNKALEPSFYMGRVRQGGIGHAPRLKEINNATGDNTKNTRPNNGTIVTDDGQRKKMLIFELIVFVSDR